MFTPTVLPSLADMLKTVNYHILPAILALDLYTRFIDEELSRKVFLLRIARRDPGVAELQFLNVTLSNTADAEINAAAAAARAALASPPSMLILCCCAVAAGLTLQSSPWPTAAGDSQRTGWTNSTFPREPPSVAWEFTVSPDIPGCSKTTNSMHDVSPLGPITRRSRSAEAVTMMSSPHVTIGVSSSMTQRTRGIEPRPAEAKSMAAAPRGSDQPQL